MRDATSLRFFALAAAYITVLALLAVPVGRYIARVFAAENRWTRAIAGWFEKGLYRAAGVDPTDEHDWRQYAYALLLFTLVTHFFTYIVLRTQQWLPLNPAHLPNLPSWLAFNTTVGFETATAWESFGGETTLSYFSQSVALVSQNFFAPATALCAAIALLRGLAAHERSTLGNAWVDLVRAHLYVLIPLATVVAILFVSQGVVQTWTGPATWQTLDGATQTLMRGPVAALESISILGSNGEGYFNANAAHPWANPTPLSNLYQLVAILLIPAALCVTLGRMTGSPRHGRAVFAALAIVLVCGATVIDRFEQRGNPVLDRAGANQTSRAGQCGGNMEGKEARFGIADSAIFATATTAASCGAFDAMHDSFMPLAGAVPMLNMQLGEVVFGGTGCGLYGIIAFIVLSVFLAGLMVGRMPEYLGKRLEAREVKFAMLLVLIPAFAILLFTALGVSVEPGRAAVLNVGASNAGPAWHPHPHGFSEVLYAYSSAGANNGSTFAGMTFYSVQHPVFYSLTLALTMFAGRFPLLVAALALAGSLAARKRAEPGPASLPVHGPLFVGLLIAVIIAVGALTFFPALSLGPVIEHLML